MDEDLQSGTGGPDRRPSADDHGGVAILNGFGRTLGDGIIGLQALTLAIQAGAVARAPVLFRLSGLSPMLQQLYAAARDIASVADLPWRYAERGEVPEFARGFHNVLDLRDFAFDPSFRRIAMIDYFLVQLGMDPGGVPGSMKRNTWLAPRVARGRSRHGQGYVLVCPQAANEMRCMPPQVHDRIVGWLARSQPRPILTQAKLSGEATLSGLCELVASAALIISTDTAMVHLADAFSRPCVAFFPTHRPEWRVRDYPHCRAVYLRSGLPDALEFPRSPADIAQAKAAWQVRGADLSWLDRVLADTFDSELGAGLP